MFCEHDVWGKGGEKEGSRTGFVRFRTGRARNTCLIQSGQEKYAGAKKEKSRRWGKEESSVTLACARVTLHRPGVGKERQGLSLAGRPVTFRREKNEDGRKACLRNKKNKRARSNVGKKKPGTTTPLWRGAKNLARLIACHRRGGKREMNVVFFGRARVKI